MKIYSMPQAQVINFDNDYVSTAGSGTGTTEGAGALSETLGGGGELVNPGQVGL